jgi:hypothetical protein
MSVVVKAGGFTFNGINYYRGNATAVTLGAVGRKKNPPFGVAYLDVHCQMPIDGAVQAVVAEIDAESSKKGDVLAKFNPIGLPLSVDAEAKWEMIRKSELKLVQFVLNMSQLKQHYLADEAVQDVFDDNRKTARIVHQIWVVMLAKEASLYSSSGSLNAKLSNRGIDVTAAISGSTTHGSTLTLSEGTTFGYLLAKAQWKNNELAGFDTDQRGFG